MTDSTNNLPIDGQDGWTNARSERAGAYFRYEEGDWVKGVLIGRHSKPDNFNGGLKYVYQIKTTAPCIAHVRNEAGGYDFIEVKTGTIVSIDEKKALEELRDLLEEDANYEVFIRADEYKIMGGRRFWDMTVLKKRFVGKIAEESEEKGPSQDDTAF